MQKTLNVAEMDEILFFFFFKCGAERNIRDGVKKQIKLMNQKSCQGPPGRVPRTPGDPFENHWCRKSRN